MPKIENLLKLKYGLLALPTLLQVNALPTRAPNSPYSFPTRKAGHLLKRHFSSVAKVSQKNQPQSHRAQLRNQFSLMIRSFTAVTAALLILLPMQPSWAALDYAKQDDILSNTNMPEETFDSAMFDDLPFAQRRQALREESGLRRREASTPLIP